MKDAIKIKIAVPATIRDQLELDINDYGLKGMGELCNFIIEHREDLPKSGENKTFTKECNELFKNCPPLQFTLHKRNSGFAKIASDKGAKTASLCRHYIEQYISLPRGKRELFIKKVELINIEDAIKGKKNVSLFYRGQHRVVAPCFTAHSPAQVRSYLVVCEDPKESFPANPKGNPFKAFRICHIKNVTVENSEAFHTKSNALYKKSEGFREHFDPFLCHGQELRVKLTAEGVALYKRAATNRPKILSVPSESTAASTLKKAEEFKTPRAGRISRSASKKRAEAIEQALENEAAGIYVMECSPELAKVYFPQFLDTAEILTPTDLRNYFRQRFLKAAKGYGLMDGPRY